MNSNLSNPDESVRKENGAAQFHQAGYDSYITGVCFYVIRWLAEQSSKKSICDDTRFRNKVCVCVCVFKFDRSNVLTFLCSIQLFNAWSFDVPFLSTEPSEDTQLDRSKVFFIKFNCEPFELENRLAAMFENCRLAFLDNESCLVGIEDKEARTKIAGLRKIDSSLMVLTYAEYKKCEQAKQGPTKKSKIEQME